MSSPLRSARARARPRAGLVGNPSDLYGGAVVAFTFDDFAAEATLEPAPRPEAPSGPGAELLTAALARFAGHLPALGLGRGEGLRARLTFTTDVPRQVGLAGSSAIVVAALRALADAHGVALDADVLARLALEAEVEELGHVAGPQDRVVQAHGGVVAMDFGREPWSVRRLDPDALPPLVVAWDPAPGRDSGATHGAVRQRWLSGDPEVRATMRRFRDLVEAGLEALEAGDRAALRAVVDANLDLRASLFPIAPRDRRGIEAARACGAGVKLCGSGGALLAVVEEERRLAGVEEALRGAGFGVVRPAVSRILSHPPA